MPRMTSSELEIQDVIDRWLREEAQHAGIRKHDRDYTSLVSALDAFLRRKERLDGDKFRKAVDLAYQNGYNAGQGLKG